MPVLARILLNSDSMKTVSPLILSLVVSVSALSSCGMNDQDFEPNGDRSDYGSIVLTINSSSAYRNISSDTFGGHSWLSVSDNGYVTTYGLYNDGYGGAAENGAGWDIRTNLEGANGSVALGSASIALTTRQYERLSILVSENRSWNFNYNCSTWASQVFGAVTGYYYNPSNGGFDRPAILSGNIQSGAYTTR